MAMLGMSCGEFCRLFCCPPCPSSIAAKLAFVPPEKTYTIDKDASGKFNLHLYEDAKFCYKQEELDLIEPYVVRTRRRNTIACMHVKLTESPKYTLLFSHGNAVDIGQMSSFYVGLGKRLRCNVFAYDYSGYGDSTGSPSEANIYADAEAAWQVMTKQLEIDPSRIIVYGQSIGTVASVDLATHHQCAGVILHSPLLSGIRVAFPNANVQRTHFFDPFPSINKIQKVETVVLVIHGTEDEVIDFSHGLCIYERAPNTVEPLWIEGAGHNDVEQYQSYLLRLMKFVDKELPAREAFAAKKEADRLEQERREVVVAMAARQASSENGDPTRMGEDGVMVLSRPDDDDDDDEQQQPQEDTETESSSGRHHANAAGGLAVDIPAAGTSAAAASAATAGAGSKRTVKDADVSVSSLTSHIDMETGAEDEMESTSSEHLLGNSTNQSARAQRHLSANMSATQLEATAEAMEAHHLQATTAGNGGRTASQTSLPPSPTADKDAEQLGDVTVMTRDGDTKQLAALAPMESLTLVYV